MWTTLSKKISSNTARLIFSITRINVQASIASVQHGQWPPKALKSLNIIPKILLRKTFRRIHSLWFRSKPLALQFAWYKKRLKFSIFLFWTSTPLTRYIASSIYTEILEDARIWGFKVFLLMSFNYYTCPIPIRCARS